MSMSEEPPVSARRPDDPLRRIVIVLNEPRNLVNIATATRAMLNMGLSRLRLVQPAEFDPHRIGGIAHRSEELVERIELFDTLEDAVAPAGLVLGTSARSRTAQRNYGWVREWASRAVEAASADEVAIVFGREDRGLSNEALDRCHGVVMIPTDPDYPSLNLAHAVLLVSYELSLAASGAELPLPRGKRSVRAATSEELEEAYRALEWGLGRIQFFKGRSPETVLRTVRTLIGRAEPDSQEAGLVRAIGYEIGHYLDRTSDDAE